ncbi:hypothetical protein BpHYR1_023248, partial [Brachionus plicatilis]
MNFNPNNNFDNIMSILNLSLNFDHLIMIMNFKLPLITQKKIFLKKKLNTTQASNLYNIVMYGDFGREGR